MSFLFFFFFFFKEKGEEEEEGGKGERWKIFSSSLFFFFFFSLKGGLSGGHFTQIKHATLLRPISILGACAYQSIGTVKQSRSLR